MWQLNINIQPIETSQKVTLRFAVCVNSHWKGGVRFRRTKYTFFFLFSCMQQQTKHTFQNERKNWNGSIDKNTNYVKYTVTGTGSGNLFYWPWQLVFFFFFHLILKTRCNSLNLWVEASRGDKLELSCSVYSTITLYKTSYIVPLILDIQNNLVNPTKEKSKKRDTNKVNKHINKTPQI